MIFVTIFLLFGCIQQVLLIKCYTCQEAGYHCSLPFSIDGGEEHNENDVPSITYDSHYVCESDRSFDPRTRQQKLILRGTQHCEQLNVANHRRYCCHSDNCNKELPPMTIRAEFNSKGNFVFAMKTNIFIVFAFLFIRHVSFL